MPQVPAVCSNCGLTFPSGIEMVNSSIAFMDVGVRCPNCHGDGRILNGVYETLGDSLHVLLTSKRSPTELQALFDALKKAREEQASPEQIKQTIEAHAPELKSLSDWIPQTRTEAYAVVALILTVISLLIANLMSKKETIVNNVIQTAINVNCQQPIKPNRHERRAQAKKARHK
jgi:predicted Zn-ribbon and HTH transcriptional regulator